MDSHNITWRSASDSHERRCSKPCTHVLCAGCREAEFLQLLDHPNIVKCYEVVENEKQMVILMEWLRGGHLLDTLEEMAGQHYSEQQAAILFVQVGIFHRNHWGRAIL